MCKSEPRFQRGKSGFNTRPKIQLAQSESNLFCFFFCFFLNKVSKTNLSLLCLAVVCPTYGTCSQEFCRADTVNWWGRKGNICPKRDETCAH